MKRFDCPQCGKSLSFRLLPIVPPASQPKDILVGATPLFTCIHCGAVLAHNEPKFTWKIGFFRTVMFLSGAILFSAVGAVLGRVVSLTAIAIVALGIGTVLLFSPKPAYRLVSSTHSANNPKL
ncbi:MAG TPA: hypothetical protein V6D07_08680 [Trichocoleus sp.]